MNGRVCAVVVTYNRKALLRLCLESLLAQSRAPDLILVVDNASTDGTSQLLQTEFPQLRVLRLIANSGGAGGFHAGMQWAHQNGFEWIWVMDDDIRTVPTALQTLLDFGHIGDLIQGRKRLTGGILVWEAIWDPNACFPSTLRRDISFENGKPWTSIQYANFEGALIRRKVIDKIGLPDTRYFIAGDDSIYGFLASFYVHAIYVNFVAFEKDVVLGKPQSRFYYYFGLRNRFLHYEHFVKAGVAVRKPIFYFHVFEAALGLFREILTRPRERTWLNAKTVVAALSDGMNGRFGKPDWI